MVRRGAGAGALLALALAAAASPPATARPLMPLTGPTGLTRRCDAGIAAARREMAAMEMRAGAGAIFAEWNRLAIHIEEVGNPAYLIGEVSPDKVVRDAAEPCLTKFTTLNTDLFQSEKLYRRVLAAKPANAHQAKLRKDLLEGFEDSGVALPPEKRARAKEIFDKLEELRQAFDRNIRDDPTKVVFTPAEMEGMSEAYLKARKRDDQGNYVLGLDYPSYFPFLTRAKSGAARERYYRAKLREGGEANLALLGQVFDLRRELAGLYGLPSFAAYSLRRKMAGSPEAVEKFLSEVHDAVGDLEKSEIAELASAKSKDLGTPLAQTKVERWDASYYQDRVRRERYAIDQEQLRRYFPTDRAIEYTMLVAQKLYGLRFREAKVPVWDPDVRYFDVSDAKTGRFIGGFYLDLFPREGKYNHAAAFPIRATSRLAHRTPLAALVTNFTREGLTQDELETMMHEFGHVMHNVLSEADYDPDAGTSVKIDFVEAPSQMFEEWARREQPLSLFVQVCPDCPHLTHDDIERLDAARRYGSGILYARQWLYATFDLDLSLNPAPPEALWDRLEGATPLGHVEGTMFPASFSHIAGGYAAGYYGYMWSQVLALDMLSVFGTNMMDPVVGMRYRREILSQGGQREESESVRAFLGRDPSSKSFFEEITGKRR